MIGSEHTMHPCIQNEELQVTLICMLHIKPEMAPVSLKWGSGVAFQ